MSGMNQLEIENAAVAMVEQRGKNVMTKVKQELLNTTYDNDTINLAIKHYAKTTFYSGIPLFPALTSLSYEAAKDSDYEKDETEVVAVAMTLIAFSADIHDDIIDQSPVKYGKKTVYGKFGPDIALLTGDALLIHGYSLLHQACETLSQKQRQAIYTTISKALFELSSAEVLEQKLRKKSVIDPDEYFEIMRLKGVFAELQCRLGGIIGHADNEMLETLSRYGRFVGMTGTIKDEFNDMLNGLELKHRIKFECPPLPMIYALHDKKIKHEITTLAKQLDYSNTITKKLAKLVLESEAVRTLKRGINGQLIQEIENLTIMEKNRATPDMILLLYGLAPSVDI